MPIKQKEIKARGVKFFAEKDGREIGRAYLYLMTNDLHGAPYGLLEDVFVQEEYRSRGTGKELVKSVMAEAKKQNCYKLIATSRYARPKVHEMYIRLGFMDWGKEFRIDFD